MRDKSIPTPERAQLDTLPRSRKDAKAIGAPRYFLDKTCPHGHNDARYASNGKCVVCMRADVRAYHVRHKDKENARCRQWAKDNPDKNRALSAKWWSGQSAEYRHHYMANLKGRERAGGGNVTLGEWLDIKRRFGNTCPACGSTTRPLTMDHIIPVAAGGIHAAENIQPLCRSCNSRKNRRAIAYEPWRDAS